MTTLAALQSLVGQGESETLELKRSTAELRRAGETLCAFLNCEGGKVLIGVGPDGRLVGQEVADITLRDIAAMLGRFEPPARVEMSRVVPRGHQVGAKSALSPYQVQVLELARVPRALAELMGPSGRTDRTKFRDQVLRPLLEAELLEMTIPDKPRSSKQQYRTTEAGRAAFTTTRKA